MAEGAFSLVARGGGGGEHALEGGGAGLCGYGISHFKYQFHQLISMT